MKRLAFIFSSIAFLAGCSQFEEIDQPIQNETAPGGNFTGIGLPEVLYASMADEGEKTKTYVDGKRVLWHRGESISYYAGTNGNVKYTMKEGQYDGTVSAEFVQAGNPQFEFGPENSNDDLRLIPEFSLGIYPYAENRLVHFSEEDGGKYNFPASYAKEQSYAPNSFGKGANFMVAVGESADDTDLHFRNACGYLVIKLYGPLTKVSSITLTALGEGVNLSGLAQATVDRNGDFTMTGWSSQAYNSVTLDCTAGGEGVLIGETEESATEFWFALPPITIEGGFQITITDADGHTYTKQTTKDVVINRNEIQPMKAFTIYSTTPSRYQIWYTQTAGKNQPVTFSAAQPFDASIKGHYYNEDRSVFVIEFNEPVKTIKKNAFLDNTDILDVILPNGLETIEEYAFAASSGKNTSLRTINIPGTVNRIENNVFCYNNSLKSITFEPSPDNTPLNMGYLPGTLNDCGQFWYTDMDRIEVNRAFNYSYSPDDSDDGIFAGAEADEIIIGEQLTEIYDYMFASSTVKTFVIPDSVKKIGEYAFQRCKFEKVHIGKNVESIGKNAFEYCFSLKELVIEDSDKTLYFNKFFALNDSSIPVEYAQFHDTKLSKIYIGRNVEYVSDFTPDENDEGLFALSVNLALDDPSFRTSVTIGPKVTTLSYRMLANCPIGSITIPGTVNTINNKAFGGCKYLTSITFEASNTIDPKTGKPTKLVLGYHDDTNQKSIFVDSPIETVHIDREISYSLETMGELDSEDEGLFGESETIKNVSFGPQAETISPYMFAYSQLTSITIPNTLKSIGYNAFMICENLKSINIEEGTSPLKIAYQWYHSTDWGPFYDSPLEYISVGREIDYRDDSDNAYAPDNWKEGLFANKHYPSDYAMNSDDEIRTVVNLSSNMRSISNYMFSHVVVTDLTIPKEITSIGIGAFLHCNRLSQVKMEHVVPPTLGEDAFDECRYLKQIQVPQASLSRFQSANAWNELPDEYSINLIGY